MDSAIGTCSLSSSSTSMSMSSMSEQKYAQLRKRLDQLGYRQTLAIESLPLIEKLFNDLVHTTESLKKAKLEISNVSRNSKNSTRNDSLLSQSALNTSMAANLEAAAYRADNTKLIKENNQLHLDFIKLKDDFDQQIKDLKSKLSKVENENCDLRFLNTQYLTKMRTIERESNSKSKKILELQERSLHASNAIIKIPEDSGLSFRRQRLDADSLLPAACNLNSSTAIATTLNSNRPAVDIKDPYVIDVVKIADERIQELEATLDHTRTTSEIWEKKCSNLKHQVELRDKEIERLNNLMEHGRPRDISQLVIENELESHEKVVKNQNMQIEYLQEKNYQLEKRLEELLEEKQNLINSHRSISDKSEPPVVKQLELERNDLSNRLNVLKSELDDRCTDINNLHELISKIQEDKAKLSKKISNLIENEKELVREVESLKYLKRSPVSATNNSKNKPLPGKLDAYVKNLESERDFYKREIDTLQELLRTKQQVAASRVSRSKSPAKPSLNRQKSSSPSTKATANRCTVCSGRSMSPGQQSIAVEEMKKLKREKDELLDKFESYMEQFQANINQLTCERDQLREMCALSKDELAKCKAAVSHHAVANETTKSHAQQHSLAVQSMLHRVEGERDAALFDLRNVIKERDSAAERLRIVTETSGKEKFSLEKEIEDTRDQLSRVEMEKNELCHQVKLLKNELDEADAKMNAQSYQLVQTIQEMNDHKSASSQIRLLADESRSAVDEHRMQIKIKIDEIQKLEQHKYHLEQKLMNMQDINRSLQDESAALRHNLTSLDKEKDKLLSSLDEKTIECATLKQELASKHHRLDELNVQFAQLETSYDNAACQLNSQKKDLNTFRIQLDRANEEVSMLTRKLESAVRENKRLQDDVFTATRESQVSHRELDSLRMEKEQLAEQIAMLLKDVRMREDILKQKECDRATYMENFRALTTDYNTVKIELTQYQSELNNCRVNLQSKQVDIKRLQERLDKAERDNHQFMSANQELEVRLSSCNVSLQKYEETLKQFDIDKKELMEDLVNMRNISYDLDQSKNELARQLTARDIECESASQQLYDRAAEIELLKSQISSERAMIKNLEELIASNRETGFHMQMTTQEKESEIKLLKDRVTLGEQKIQNQSKDINVLRTRLAEMEADNEKMRRQLTNERFERERAAQELRKKIESSSPSLMHHHHHHQHISNNTSLGSPHRSVSPPKKSSLLNYSSSASSTCCPTPAAAVSSAAAAVAAAAAAAAASNVAAAASGYRSLSPIRTSSTIITKEHSTVRYST